jgi:hypothetical protein
MADDRIDLSSLDPTADAERFEHIVRAISGGAAGALAARRARASVFGQVGLWWRPLLAAAALAGIISVTALTRLGAPPEASEPEIGIAEAIGVPQQIAQWVRSDELPSPAELLLTLEEQR